MKQEEKQLLLADLCGRLLYHPKGVKLNTLFDPEDITITGYTGRFVETVDDEIEVEKVRLYLRPLSSITDEETEELRRFGGILAHNLQRDTIAICAFAPEAYDWFNEHHFDFRGLIEKSLAIVAPKGMYKTE